MRQMTIFPNNSTEAASRAGSPVQLSSSPSGFNAAAYLQRKSRSSRGDKRSQTLGAPLNAPAEIELETFPLLQ